MPGFWDSGFIILLALLLFGPKKLPVLARQFGKLMGDFRRASNEFRSQMEEELRISEQAERQKQIAAIEAAAPPTPAIEPAPGLEHSHVPAPEIEPVVSEAAGSLPIATSGELNLMPPFTGLPLANTALSPLLDSIPEMPSPETSPVVATEHGPNGAAHEAPKEPEARPWMI
jgi:sec-independent protein translocase protein TatB